MTNLAPCQETRKKAENNLRILENATEKDIKRMAEEFRVQMVNQGKRKTLNLHQTTINEIWKLGGIYDWHNDTYTLTACLIISKLQLLFLEHQS